MLGSTIRGALLLSIAALLTPAAAGAAVIEPNTFEDQYNTDPAHCSLREAVTSAEGSIDIPGCTDGVFAAEDTIRLAPGTYELTTPQSINGEVDLTTGDLDHNDQMVVEAVPGGAVVIDSNGHDKIFGVLGGGLKLAGITLTGGAIDEPGGSNLSGGAISSTGGTPVEVRDSTIAHSSSDGGGGAIYAAGPLTLTNVTISDNTTTGYHGGAILAAGASALLDNVTLTDNKSTEVGVLGGGGGIVQEGLTVVTVHNSIVAGNSEASTTVGGADCQGSITSAGGNVIGTTEGCTFASLPGDALNIPAGLGSLADNGGSSFTHALLAGSPALDRGVGACPAADQRGIMRPQGPGCDAGAFELVVPPASVLPPPAATSKCRKGFRLKKLKRKKKRKCVRKKRKRRK